MKQYTAPQVTMVCENWNERTELHRLVSWKHDPEAQEVIVEARFESMEWTEYLKAQGEDPADYGAPLENQIYLHRLAEPVTVCRIPCDKGVAETTNEWDDERGHHVEILTSEQAVAFQMNGSDRLEEVFEYYEDDEDFDPYFQMDAADVRCRLIAVKCDGVFWLFHLDDMKWLEVENYDENGDCGFVPFHCTALCKVSTWNNYTRGGDMWEPEVGEKSPYAWREDFFAVCEDENGVQYGLEGQETYAEVQMIQEDDQPWTSVSMIRGSEFSDQGVLFMERKDEDGISAQKVCRGLGGVLASYSREMDGDATLETAILTPDRDEDFRMGQRTSCKLLRIIKGKELQLKLLLGAGVLTEWARKDLEAMLNENEIYRRLESYFVSYQVMQRQGERFVLKYNHRIAGGVREEFYMFNDGCQVGGVWDAVTMLDSGLCIVKKDGYFGIVDPTGKVIVPLRYSAIEPSASGEMTVLKLERFGQKGMGYLKGEAVECEEAETGVDKEGYFGLVLEEEKKMPVLQWTFRQTIPCEFESVSQIGMGLVSVEKMGRTAQYNLETGRMHSEFTKK